MYVPRALYEQGLDDIVVKKLSIDCKPTDLSEWDSVVNKLYSPEAAVDIAMVGKCNLTFNTTITKTTWH
jgi:CTP synthase